MLPFTTFLDAKQAAVGVDVGFLQEVTLEWARVAPQLRAQARVQAQRQFVAVLRRHTTIELLAVLLFQRSAPL